MEFFIIRNDEQQGPFTLEQLSGMSIMPDTPVWCEGMPDWTTADKVAALQPLVAYAPRVGGNTEPPTMPHGSAPQPPQWNNAQSQQATYAAPAPQYAPAPRAKKSHTAPWVTLAIVAVLAAALAITNPDKSDHCNAISKVTKDWTGEKIENIAGDGIAGGVVKAITTPIMSKVVESIVDVDNYGLCSVGHIDIGDSKTKVSFGIMGHVFTFNKAQIDAKIKEQIGITVDDAVNGIKESIGGWFDDDEEASAEVPANPEDEVTAEERAESNVDTPNEMDTIMSTITKEVAKGAGKVVEDALNDLFE